MAPTRGNRRKKRTREHVIADLGVNHVEKQVLGCGFTVQRSEHDYGVDMFLFTYDSNGECENGAVRLQVKATDHLKVSADGLGISFRLDLRDVRHWIDEIMPVILVVYDAPNDKAYWLYVQQYFSKLRKLSFSAAKKKSGVAIPMEHVVNMAAIRRFAQFRDDVLRQTKGAIINYD